MSSTLAIARLQVQNYKSLRNVSLPFVSATTVLVGRNGSGKSSFLDVFEFIKEAHTDPATAIKKRGANAQSLIWGNLSSEEAKITIDFDVPEGLRESALAAIKEKHPTAPNGTGVVTRLSREDVEKSSFLRTLRYELRFGTCFFEGISTEHPVIAGDRYPLAARSGGTTLFDSPWDSRNDLWNATDPNFSLRTKATGIRYDPQGLPSLLFRDYMQTDSVFAFTWLTQFFQTLYHIDAARQPEHDRTITSTRSIDSAGTNLVDVLNYLRNNEENLFHQIESDLKRLVDGIDSLSTPTVGAATTGRIRQTLEGNVSVFFDLKQMSAGTAQLLVLLTQLHTQLPGSFVLLEEAENLLHPSAQAQFYRILRKLPLIMLISTQSPIIASESRLDSAFLLKRTTSGTTIHPFSEEGVVEQVVQEMGIRPSYNFEANTVVFVEGPWDEAVFRQWLDKLNLCKSISIIGSGGYSNMPFWANAIILRKKVVRTNVFAVVDGDTKTKGDYKRIQNALDIPDSHLFELDVTNLECLLAIPDAINNAFPGLNIESDSLSGNPDGLKNKLGRALAPVGGYTKENAAKIAQHVEPSEGWRAFFEMVDAKNQE